MGEWPITSRTQTDNGGTYGPAGDRGLALVAASNAARLSPFGPARVFSDFVHAIARTSARHDRPNPHVSKPSRSFRLRKWCLPRFLSARVQIDTSRMTMAGGGITTPIQDPNTSVRDARSSNARAVVTGLSSVLTHIGRCDTAAEFVAQLQAERRGLSTGASSRMATSSFLRRIIHRSLAGSGAVMCRSIVWLCRRSSAVRYFGRSRCITSTVTGATTGRRIFSCGAVRMGAGLCFVARIVVRQTSQLLRSRSRPAGAIAVT